MKLLKCRPLTWSVLRRTLINIKHIRNLCVPASLYEKSGKWSQLLNRETMLEIEDVWRERLCNYDATGSTQTSQARDTGEKFYVLSMFPYPSGKLHMGHVRVYTISDMMARYHRMLGDTVIHPMGWDAFGLPAENAAIERDLHPRDWTYSNISTMKEQLKSLGCAFDWEREVTTCDPSYYRWTQYIFLKMYEAGLVYQKQGSVNWDPVDQTVLADEQIDELGHSWRSGAKVETRYLRQWYIKTSAYAQPLYSGLDTVSSELWKDVISLQKFWIGECSGCRFEFQLSCSAETIDDPISVYTGSPEAVYGISHIAVSTSHRFNQEMYHVTTDGSSTVEGEVLLNIKAKHPLTGELLPVVVSEISEELMDHTDSCLGIPCVSDIDRRVAELHGFQCRQVFTGEPDNWVLAHSNHKIDGLCSREAADIVMSIAREQGFGGDPVSSRMRDWLISRQRYWGTPIPMIHCTNCKAVPVPLEDLPVVLPYTSKPSAGKGHSGLQDNEQWLNVKCPKCGGPAKRETDTMDTFVDSSWYFLRYLDATNQDLPVSHKAAEKYMPVDLYIGGIEHAYMHLYYARFMNRFLCDAGLACHREPFVNLLTQGMVKGESYKVEKTGVYLPPSQVEKIDGKYVQKSTGERLIVKYEKMSKSKHNGVDPEELFKEFGTDMTRLCILSNVAPKSDRNWNNEVYVGVIKWLNRVWSLVGTLVARPDLKTTATQEQVCEWDAKIRTFRNNYLAEIRFHMNRTFLFNTAISRMHEITNDLKKVPVDVAVESAEYRRAVMDLVKMIAPIVPMFTSECWAALKQPGHVLDQRWPDVDEDTLLKLNIKCNVNRIGSIELSQDKLHNLTKETAMALAEKETFYKETIMGNEVTGCVLDIRPGWCAHLNLNVPGVVEETAVKKKKKEKKKSKT